MEDFNIDTFLQTVFDSKESNWKPSDKIPIITKEIDKLKADLTTFFDNKDHDLSGVLRESKELCEESKSLVDDMVKVKKEIEEETMAEILRSIEDHDAISKELAQSNFALDIIGDVIQCGKYVKEFDDGREAGSFTRAVEAVYDLIQYINNPVDGYEQLDLYGNTKHTAKMILDSLLHDLFSVWDKMVSFDTKVEPQETVVTLTLNSDSSLIILDVLNALERCNKLQEKISQFAKFLMKEIIAPIIHHECTILIETGEMITVHITKRANVKPKYLDVLNNLKSLFQFLATKLSIEVNHDSTIIQMVARDICTEFSDTLVKDCLIDTVPNNIEELGNYHAIIAEISLFQTYMFTTRIYKENQFNVLGYLDNIEVIFADKASQNYLETARTIMLKDLSVTMSIGVESVPEEEQTASTDESTDQAFKILEKNIPKSLFYFPRCMISKSAQELLDLVNEMIEQGVQGSDEDVVPKRMYNTTRLVFELYEAVVPYHHEKYLQTIPQYVALFHNNCMYLAHNLQTLGDKWITLMDGRHTGTFLDLVQPLRDLGYKHLAAHLQYQRKQILDNIRSSDLNNMAAKDSLGPNAESAVRQCIRQLTLLKSVWIGVLPHNVFTNLMSTLINMFVSELIHRVVCVEDISAEMATQLSSIYSLVVLKAGSLLQNPSDVSSHVPSWAKLQELIFVLGGSLKDIEAHWADGTGLLAQLFTTDQIRNLVKALFQNTQFRANLLSKIK